MSCHRLGFRSFVVLGLIATSCVRLEAQPLINVQSNGPDGAILTLQNLPPGTQSGVTVVSADTTLAVGAGGMWGLNMGLFPFLLSIFSAPPPTPGNPISWSFPSPAFPNAPFVVPSPGLLGIPSFDVLGVIKTPGGLVASNVSRYVRDPGSVGLNTGTIQEGTPFQVTLPGATSTNGVDFCALAVDATGAFDRILLNNTAPGVFNAALTAGAQPGTATVMIAQGTGGTNAQVLPGPMTVSSQFWTALNPTTMIGPSVATTGSGQTGSTCGLVGTCWSKYYQAVPIGSLAHWTVTIPAAVAACICIPNSTIVLDIHGNYMVGATSGQAHFDDFTTGTLGPGGSMDPCACLTQVMLQFSISVNTANPNITIQSSCTTLTNGDIMVTMVFQLAQGGTFVVPPSGKLKICH